MTAVMTRRMLTLGRVVSTPAARAACGTPYLMACLARHQSGDWGCVSPEDGRANDQALRYGDRVLSAYPVDPEQPCKGWGDNTLWIITEADRSTTTFLLPEEY